jgi:hypothetical protein
MPTSVRLSSPSIAEAICQGLSFTDDFIITTEEIRSQLDYLEATGAVSISDQRSSADEHEDTYWAGIVQAHRLEQTRTQRRASLLYDICSLIHGTVGRLHRRLTSERRRSRAGQIKVASSDLHRGR